MILTCPECATRYSVDEQRLGPQGRTVRCANCSASWRAESPPEPPLELMPVAASERATESMAPPPVHASFRAKVEAKRRTREAVAAGVVWGVLAGGFALLLLVSVLFRVQVVRIWPRTAGAYAAVHLAVNPLGLAPEDVKAATSLQDGQVALVVTGLQRNIETAPRSSAPMKVSVLDKTGKALTSRVVRPTPGPIAPGESRSFVASFLDPPIAAATVQVDFVIEKPTPKAQPAQAVRAKPLPKLRRIAAQALPVKPIALAKTAEPLPTTSPYALPAAARGDVDAAPKLRPRG